ncbi:MAG: porin family protein [Rhodobacteraceae bacterium]|nr:porin family protein [Paracoccaceae bacterium]
MTLSRKVVFLLAGLIASGLSGAGHLSAQTGGPDTTLAADGAAFGCNLNPGSGASIRCCLALLNSRALGAGDTELRGAAEAYEARLLALLAARGESDQPRVCPTPTSFPTIIIWPDSIKTGKPVQRVGPPVPKWQLMLGFGTPLNAPEYRFPTGAGTAQDFPLVPFSGGIADLRLSWLMPLGRQTGRPDGSLGRHLEVQGGFSFSEGHVDRVVNFGGIFHGTVNTGFEGSMRQYRPYVGLAYVFPLWVLGASSSFPLLEGSIGGNVGYSTLKIDETGGGFSTSRNGWDYGLELGLNMQLNDKWKMSHSVSGIFGTPGLQHPQVRYYVGVKHSF